ncbi:phosphoribosylformylglycinamidine synthase-like [Chrysemys picta bellii]|uniref:phosphoribosylformylglycinamidine synthase-like n=1 Tax=Chrysemys picta bellii TaxID=8478 RepID=UPI0032B1EA3F
MGRVSHPDRHGPGPLPAPGLPCVTGAGIKGVGLARPGEEDKLAAGLARCLPGRGETYRRFLFRSRRQGSGKLAEAFVAALQRQSRAGSGHQIPWGLPTACWVTQPHSSPAGASPPSPQETQLLHWLFGCPLESGDVATESFLRPAPTDLLIEIGPRLNFSTAFSTNVVSVCRAAGLGCVDRVERSHRYLLQCAQRPTPPEEDALVAVLSDRMTEQRYKEPIRSFTVTRGRPPCPHLGCGCAGEGGRTALERANQALGYPLPWEDPALPYPQNYAHPLQVAVRASDGASDYGNKFGEPVLAAQPGPRVAILREESSNGDREMVAAFVMAGFQAWDVTMQDLFTGEVTLKSFRGLVFVGGFSYADVLRSAKGWAASVTFNPQARAQFEAFRRRRNTFSLGICNGCQLMALLGWVGGESPQSDPTGGALRPGVLLTPNDSGWFESRFVALAIEESPAVMLRGMAGSTLGIWVAHGEGRMRFRSPEVLAAVTSGGLAPLRYVDDQGQPTQEYPLNPNGSPLGIAGLCSPDGRHLAMMPHPERCVLPWQWAWMPPAWRRTMEVSPWLRMFQNACEWCLRHPEGES